MSFAVAGIAAVFVAVLCTLAVKSISRRLNILDRPENAPERKIHTQPTPLLGGVAVYVAFAVVIGAVLIIKPTLLLGGYLLPKQLVGVLLGGVLLMIGGFLDDKKQRKPAQQIIWPILAALVVLASGIGIDIISNPLGNAFHLDLWTVTLFHFHDLPYNIILPADLFAFAWLLGAMYTTKLLDGLDGLVSGITTIGMIILFALSITPTVGQPETATLAIIAAGAFLGFLLFNFHPAKIFLGEGGSLFAGFLLGTLAIISGGKIATALLILGIPVLDVVWVILRRLFVERRSATAKGDRKHLHHRLLEMGLSHRQTVVLLYVLTAVFGSATLLVHGTSKIIVLVGLAVLMIILGIVTVLIARRRHASVSMNSNRIIWTAVILSLLFSCAYILTNRMPEAFVFGSEIMSFLYALAISTIAASIFYLLQVYIPEKRRREIVKSNFKLNYALFKENSISIFLSILGTSHSSDLLSKLSNLEEFKSYFEKDFIEGQNRWHGVLNGLNGKFLKDLLVQLQILSQEIDYFLNNVSLRDEKVLDFLKRLKIAAYSLESIGPDYDEIKTLSDIYWELFAGWSRISGYRKNDIFEEMLDRV